MGNAVCPNLQLPQAETVVVVWVNEGSSSGSFRSDQICSLVPETGICVFSLSSHSDDAETDAECLWVPSGTGDLGYM